MNNCFKDITEAFLQKNNLQCIVRSHEETREGCQLNHPGCYTVFSAPNRSKGVLGGVITLHKEKEEGEEDDKEKEHKEKEEEEEENKEKKYKEKGYKMRLESFVFSQTDKPAKKPGAELLPDDKHTGDAR